MAETKFRARKSHPVQTRNVTSAGGRKFQIPRTSDEAPRPTKSQLVLAKGEGSRNVYVGNAIKGKARPEHQGSSATKSKLTPAKVKGFKAYLKQHDIFVADNRQISFKQYLADQNEDLPKEGSRLHQEKPGSKASKREMKAWQAKWNEFDTRNRASLRKPREEELERKRQKYGFDKEDQD